MSRDIRELRNPRISYQIIITFDLEGAESEKYEKLRKTLALELELDTNIYLSESDDHKITSLPFNTLATLWRKDSTEQETRDYIEKTIKKAFLSHRLKGRYVIVVAQNWAVAAGNVDYK
ncbi:MULTISPECIES: hypothetical protein [unclassified Methylophilus]|uniref:hypothetical protein n=1 Tax=unclassified Methylophilus TaxID=2630143 RepID=UPI000701F110|nr:MULTISPECIES: hypothetical protein [unclassified Methylophilus]KQT42508.1 hypothetical protein ASG34_07130 [Methylophilus sp. Leaf416]KQT56691.1 hypothetical protein ASG44_07105 [Methylophilus sp. Leaf459]